MEQLNEMILPGLIHMLEFMGIFTITVGSVKCFIRGILSWRRKTGPSRLELGQALALGLEYKMGAEILKTVLIRDMSEIWILGAVILLRAVLSLLIHFEMKEELPVDTMSGE